MAECRESVESIAARSNLVPTAGEFVPRMFNRPNSYAPRHNNANYGNPTDNMHHGEVSHPHRDNNHQRTGRDRLKRGDAEADQPRGGGRLWRDGDRNGGIRNHENDNSNRYRSGNGHPRNRFKPSNGDRFKRQQSYENSDESPSQPPDDSETVSSTRRNQNGGQTRFFNNRPNFERPKHYGSSNKKRYDFYDKKIKEDGKNQLEVLVSLLTKGELECLVCCEHVKQSQATWSCSVCHHVLHLRCVTKWARSSRDEFSRWVCPACRQWFEDTPDEYLCFCGKSSSPVWNRVDCPHTCGDICGLPRPQPCSHKCTLPCHPGPCPPCRLFVNRSCGCGRASQTVLCAEAEPIRCGSPCGRLLNCQQHKCDQSCHEGECQPCNQTLKQECHCGRSSKEVPCTKDNAGVSFFSCEEVCDKKLSCGNHDCSLICHSGPCQICSLMPESTVFCPCGQTRLSSISAPPRISCTDPLPTCDAVCGKVLPCGEPGNRHQCACSCHEGPCSTCPGETTVRCRCGHMNKTIPCAELAVRADDARCEKKCNKRKSCGKHKCREPCCIDSDHLCLLPCTRTLSCGLHRCEEPCHSAYCRPCPRVSFEELLCECGVEILFPPVPCGARRPECSQPCSRQHPCDHPATHNCHSDPQCPPCTVLVARRCHGGHELRKAVPCHMESFSCGLPCGRPLPCSRHTCILPCHDGPCLKERTSCTQPCAIPRNSCGHNCNAPCHEPPCPEISCKETVKVTCECGHRFSTRSCVDNARDYQRIATMQLASKMADLAAGQSIDINVSSKKISFKTLECTEECKVIERNRRMAIGLQIRNPDLSAKLTPRYSEFLRGWAKKDPHFCQMTHDKLTELVKLAKESKQKSRSYSFDPMNRDKRQFIHEYCEHFGCESVAYDKEPKRNIVATALRDKSWLPCISLVELIQRESGARKVPLPNNAKVMPTQKSMEVLSTRLLGASSTWADPSSSNQS